HVGPRVLVLGAVEHDPLETTERLFVPGEMRRLMLARAYGHRVEEVTLHIARHRVGPPQLGRFERMRIDLGLDLDLVTSLLFPLGRCHRVYDAPRVLLASGCRFQVAYGHPPEVRDLFNAVDPSVGLDV